MSNVPFVSLNDGNQIPQLGYGVWQVPDDVAERTVGEALKVGYRHVDTAAIYGNEAGVGRALKNSEVKRDELFITTKIWNSAQGRDATLSAFDVSMKKLGLETLDLILIHWPVPKRGLYVETWKTLVELKAQGRVKSIGVSNFFVEHLEKIIEATGVTPVLNQIELHPKFVQKELRGFHEKHHIATEAWSPLGQGKLIENSELKAIAAAVKRTTAQVMLRWHLQHGFVVIPKSATPSRIKENFEVFDFELSGDQMARIDAMDSADGRIGPHPVTSF